MQNPQIILASASPRRRELLDQIGVRYQVRPVEVDETPDKNESPEHYVVRVAADKAARAKREDTGGLPVLAADTAVVLNGMILGKPKDKVDAVSMLTLLSGNTHQVYSAVTLWGKRHWQALNVTDVAFRKLTGYEIANYWQTGEPADKAGAYAIQGLGALFVQKIAGSFSGVVGLPLYETAGLLDKAGIKTALQRELLHPSTKYS